MLKKKCQCQNEKVHFKHTHDLQTGDSSCLSLSHLFVLFSTISSPLSLPSLSFLHILSLTPAVTLSQKLHLLWSGLDLVIFAGTFFSPPWLYVHSVRLEEGGCGWKYVIDPWDEKWVTALFFLQKRRRGKKERKAELICVRKKWRERERIVYPQHGHTP